MRSKKQKQEYAVMISLPGQQPHYVRLSRETTRVGSHPACEIRLPENYVSRMVAVIEVKESAVLIHNKSGHPFQMDSHELPPNESASWFDGQSIQVNSFVSLALIARVKQRAIETELGKDPDEDVIFTPKTIFCLLAMALLLGVQLFDSLAPRQQYADPVKELIDQGQHSLTDDPLKGKISYLLQEARIHHIRHGQPDLEKLSQAARLIMEQKIDRQAGPADVWYDQAFDVMQKLMRAAGLSK